ncbi:MAG: (2Fe-2S)-binding protein [Acidobacteria bacterium]|nr:(2Fe-2S)-binding protein [Acidobacteriota bacterium]
MKKILNLQVNGETHEIAVNPADTLLHVLREGLGLIGTKRGCDSGGCGCCTVLVDGKAVYSCMLLALSAVGKSIVTIEGLSTDGKLDPLQEAFIKAGAVQCGFCVCGMIISSKGLLMENPHPKEAEIRQALSGNLCRCTGYHKIVEAVRIASAHS